jgi:hypothetical protein
MLWLVEVHAGDAVNHDAGGGPAFGWGRGSRSGPFDLQRQQKLINGGWPTFAAKQPQDGGCEQ